MKTVFFDCFGGASGDMIVGALLDAGADFEAVQRGLASLDLQGYSLSAEIVQKHGIRATQFHVNLDEQGHHHHHHDHDDEAGHAHHGHQGHHGHHHHHHHQPNRHLHDIVELIAHGDLSESVKQGSIATFRRIAECEGRIHGKPPEEVHFHEVGAVDSIIDIVGAHIALNLLAPDEVVVSPMPTGFGTIHCAHGVMPVPAPATAALIQNAPSYAGDVEGERLTPTGAALLTGWAARYGAMPAMKVSAIGYGSGTRDYPDRANVLRVVAGESADALPASEEVLVVETNVDDMTSELMAPLLAAFLNAGARDAFITPILAKKGRPGHLITVLCEESQWKTIAEIFFRQSTTFGIRVRTERRVCLDRSWKPVQTAWGRVRVKIGAWQGETCRTAPEFEDCRTLAGEAGVSVMAVYEQALAAAVKGEWCDA